MYNWFVNKDETILKTVDSAMAELESIVEDKKLLIIGLTILIIYLLLSTTMEIQKMMINGLKFILSCITKTKI